MVTHSSFSNNLSSPVGNKSVQAFTSKKVKALFKKALNKSTFSSDQMENSKPYFLKNISDFAGNETIQTPVASTIQEYHRFHPQNFTPQIWYISVLVLLPTSIFMCSQFMRNVHPNVKFVVFLLANSMMCLWLSFLHSIFTNEHTVAFDDANVYVFIIVALLSELAVELQ